MIVPLMLLEDLFVLFFVGMVFARATNNVMMAIGQEEMAAQTVEEKVDLIVSRTSMVDLFVLQRVLLIVEMAYMSQTTMNNVTMETA